MLIIEILYLTAATVSLTACTVQLQQLIRSKHSHEFDIQSWVVLTLIQGLTLLYVIAIESVLMMFANLLWVSFYAVMVLLIWRYRHAPLDQVAAEA